MDVDEVGRVHPLFTRIRRTLLRYVRRVTRAVCLSVCRLSVTFVQPTQTVELFGNMFAL